MIVRRLSSTPFVPGRGGRKEERNRRLKVTQGDVPV